MTIQNIKIKTLLDGYPQEITEHFLRVMSISRESDDRENKLFRQGRGQLHVSSAGHEAIVGITPLIKQDDAVYCYYRDRALVLGMGVPLYDLALDYFAKGQSSSAGRQMANHYSYKQYNIMPSASPTGMQCLPATGMAWGFKKKNNKSVVFCFMGEACTRQGEFFEALAFSLQESLPIIFVVEDNGYGISTPTEGLNPLNLGMIPRDMVHAIDGRDPFHIYEAMGSIINSARLGKPSVVWLKLDRLMSHTSSDDHTKYRKAEELERIKEKDPLSLLKHRLLHDNLFSQEELSEIEAETKDHVRQVYNQAENAPEPNGLNILSHILAPVPLKPQRSLDIQSMPETEWRMSKAINYTLDTLLRENNRVILFGEDIEDPKGGVFGLTKALSTRYPGRVMNSPLAEATIAGLASGLSLAGFLPIFELQFIDFVGPAFHQIVNQIATLRWRTAGQAECPLVLYAPCGGYIANGGPWHTQTNESWFAHTPGLKVYMPSNANDAAQMLYSATYGQDPVLLLLPKYQFQASVPIESLVRLYPEKANIKRRGSHITIVAWGNCVELAMQAADCAGRIGIDIEVVDLCAIVPCDWQTIYQSVKKTGRLIVVQEDSRTCSFGQAIISEVITRNDIWEQLYAPPQLVTKEDVYIGFNKNLEKAVLPNVDKIMEKVASVLGRTI